MSDLLLSVVMPAYNAEKYIRQAIDSVQKQTYQNWELIIVDDCSTDQTAQVVLSYVKQDIRIHYSKLPVNSGNPYIPRNKAAKLANGDYLIHLDSDDYLEENFLSCFVEKQQETEADGIMSVMHLVSEVGEPLNQTIPNMNFDLMSVISGKEAFCNTVPWRISLNGAGFRKEIVLKSIIQHQQYTHGAWCDEVLSRMFLLNSETIAFSTAKYYYRVNPTSLVHTFSPKLFDMILAASDVKRLCVEQFPQDERMHASGEMYVFDYFDRIVGQYIQGKSSLSSSSRKQFKEKLRRIYKELDFSLMGLSVGVLSRICMTNGFDMYYIIKRIKSIIQ